MYTVIRTYQGVVDTAEVTRRAMDEFAPQLRHVPGFQGYWVVDAGDGVVATITAFDSEDAAVEASSVSATWVQENVPTLVPNPPRVTAGETTGVTAEVSV